MNRVIILAAAAAIAITNTAKAGIFDNNDNDNQTTQTTTVTTEGGDAVAIGKGGDADAKVYNSGNSHQRQDQDQRQNQGQLQGQGQSVDESGNSSIIWNDRRQVAQANAAAAIVAACGDKTAGIAAQTPAFGGSVSLPFGSSCKTLAKAAFLKAAGYVDAAIRLLCLDDDDVAEAMGPDCKLLPKE